MHADLEEGEEFELVDIMTGAQLGEKRKVMTTPVKCNDEDGTFFEVQAEDGEYYDVRWSSDHGCWVGEGDDGEDDFEDDDEEEESW